MPQLRPFAFISRQELIKALLNAPGDPVFTIYAVTAEKGLAAGKTKELLPIRIEGREMVIDLAVKKLQPPAASSDGSRISNARPTGADSLEPRGTERVKP